LDGAPVGAQLPAGAWLVSLRQLVLPGELLAASLGVLETAQQLTLIGTLIYCETTQEQLAELIRWAGKQPRPRLLGLAASKLAAAQREQISEAQRRQPGLPIRWLRQPVASWPGEQPRIAAMILSNSQMLLVARARR
jgi:hypothetical protein